MPNEQTELISSDARIGRPAPIASMLERALSGGITTDNVAALQGLMQLYREEQDRQAERDFAAAFVSLQSEMPRIQAIKPVPDKFGNTKYFFAPFEHIMEQARPALQRNGFTITFSSEIKDDRVTQSCTLQHIGGHKRTNQSMARIGSGPPGATPSQADGAASTYAKRFALCDALNIVVERDSDAAPQDARNEGAPITRDEAQFLRESVKDTGSNEAAFLKMAGAATYEEIGSAAYPMLCRMLEAKKRK